RVLALDHHLRQPFMVAQVDEGHMGLQTDLVDPAAQGDGLADQRLVDEAAKMRTHALGTPGRVGGKSGGKDCEFYHCHRGLRWQRLSSCRQPGALQRAPERAMARATAPGLR